MTWGISLRVVKCLLRVYVETWEAQAGRWRAGRSACLASRASLMVLVLCLEHSFKKKKKVTVAWTCLSISIPITKRELEAGEYARSLWAS